MAVEEGAMDRHPAIGVRVQVPEVEKSVLTHTQVHAFLSEARITGHRFYPVWLLALFTGMRSRELYALLWSDVDLESRFISVSKQWTSKCGVTATKPRRSRLVPISEELKTILRDWRAGAADSSGHVLPRLKEWEHGEQALVTRAFCRGIGITPVKFHDLRATFITNLLARGESLARVMAIVGHPQIKTTNVYLRMAGVDVRGATDKLEYSIPAASCASVLRL